MSSFEVEFKEKLYEKVKSQTYLIPREQYYKILEDLKNGYRSLKYEITSPVVQYYILKKFEVLVCDDVEKLITQRKTQDEHPVYYTI